MFYPLNNWADVMMVLRFKMAPAPVMIPASSTNKTIHGHDPWTAAVPPTIRFEGNEGFTVGTPHGTATRYKVMYWEPQ